MKGYIVTIDREVKDAQGLAALSNRLRGMLEDAGGEFLVRGGNIHPMDDGSTPPARIMVAQFESLEAVQQLFAMSEFVALREERHQFATSTTFIVEGV